MLTENLPDAGKAQDFMKKFNQVLGEDEKLRLQLEMLISPTCSCKQAETCVVSRYYIFTEKITNPIVLTVLCLCLWADVIPLELVQVLFWTPILV